MSLQSSPLYSMLGDKMNWLTERQRVISQNIANSDTPGYRAKEIADLDFSKSLRAANHSLALERTDGGHIPSPKEREDFRVSRQGRPYEVSPSGNAVILEEQMMKMNETTADYNLATSLFKKYQGLYQIALGSGR
ncbi:flagellar basal body rod protein FlgB [Aestuariispira ectoiniformans]|uniref:flagellar basal body rod protein FlgB n=1 Tax=Aestuariispira ectoiniformans TaxID=2775080 RepID=UPI00223A9803|nr:flagellar basal body rod protein FlgB [Aestuariispira ectoiniformans]